MSTRQVSVSTYIIELANVRMVQSLHDLNLSLRASQLGGVHEILLEDLDGDGGLRSTMYADLDLSVASLPDTTIKRGREQPDDTPIVV